MAKKQFNWVLPTFLAAGTGLLIWKGKDLITLAKTAGSLIIDFNKVYYSGVSGLGKLGSELKFTLQMSITNPTNKALKIETLFLNIIIPKDKTIGIVRLPSLDKIFPPNSTTPLKIEVKVSLLNAATTLYSIIKSFFGKTSSTTGELQLPKSIMIKGSMRANGILVPINEEVPLSSE